MVDITSIHLDLMDVHRWGPRVGLSHNLGTYREK
jgi:hypothetical protein